MRLIQNRYTPKVPSRGQSLLTTFAYILSIRKISFSLFQLSQHNPMQENLGVALCKTFSLAFDSAQDDNRVSKTSNLKQKNKA